MARPAVLLALAGITCALGACASSDSPADDTANARNGDATARDTSTPTPAATDAQASTPASASPSGATPTAGPSPDPSGSPGSAGSSGPSGGATVQGAGRCSSGVLVGSVAIGAGGGAAGSSVGTLTFRNDGGAPCTLEGYPGVSLVDPAGRQLGAAADRTATSDARVITLQPGGSATAALRIADPANYSAGDCQATASNGLRIYPPGSRTAIFVQRDLRGCADPQAHLMSVGPVVASGGQGA